MVSPMRKQVGELDSDLIREVDEAAAILGQTRRVYVERALRAALDGHAQSQTAPQPSAPAFDPSRRTDAFRTATQKRKR